MLNKHFAKNQLIPHKPQNYTYSSSKSNSLRDKAEFFGRKKMYDVLSAHVPMHDLDSVVDVGVTADQEKESSNFFEKLYPYPDKITALSDQDASHMEQAYPGLRFVRGDGMAMPFEDNTFDLVFSSAVIEHVGSRENQLAFIRECVRISKKYVFLTTPNRFYPIELHTALPLLHWLEPCAYRTVLRRIGKEFYASEDNLNLLCKNDILKIMAGIVVTDFQIRYIRFLGFKSNLLLMITK